MRIFNPATEAYADVTPEAFQQVWALHGWVPADPEPGVDGVAEDEVPVTVAMAPVPVTAEVTADNDGPVRAKAKDK
jgi:hypothetical protein